MRAKSLLLLFLALGCGLVASIGITQVISSKDSGSPSPSGEMATIFTALEDLPMGDMVTAQSLKLEEWPVDKVPPGALTRLEDIEGRRPKSRIVAGVPIVDSQLLGKGISDEGAAPQIPPGYRVVSVRVNDMSGISNMIRPRDRVDVLLYMKETPGVIAETGTQTILQDVQVFAVNDVFRIQETEGETSIAAKTISLLVTPGQAEVVTLATNLGTIQLTLRPHEDKKHVESSGTYAHELDQAEESNRDAEELPAKNFVGGSFVNNIVKSRAAPEPAPEPVKPTKAWTMQLIQGSQISEVEMHLVSDEAATNEPNAHSSGFDRWKIVPPKDNATVETAVAKPETPAADREETDEEDAETTEADD
ncbi:MAG: Flp pilus assembly protein CpaB [Planctomycetes bacterium]|nr:Flp pilus assembly protein CpaB [Planctomycetota bacterium]